MKRLLFAAALVAVGGLAGCTTVHNPIAPTAAFGLVSSYGVAQAAGLAYAALPRCSATVKVACSKASIVAQETVYDKKARAALMALQNFASNPSNYPGLTYAAIYASALSAIQDYKDYIDNANAKGAAA